jgi:thiol-disulfide isomerase/thioredoxin
MRIVKLNRWLLAGFVLVGTGLVAQAKTPTVEEMLAYSPIQKGVSYSTPTRQEYGQCKVEAVQGATKGSTGWVLKDPKGLIVRKYMDTAGRGYPDQWSYYKDGLEVYREIDSNFNGKGFNGKVDHYMWLNSAGMKVGVDRNEDGIIDAWEAISVEELSQEVVRAVATKDIRVLQALFVTEEDLKSLGAPAREITRIGELQKAAPAKFQKLCGRLTNLNDTTKWVHLEAQPPSRLAADTTGMKQDVFMYYRAMVLCETGKKSDYIQLAEIVQVGDAWKLLDGPLPADADTFVNVNQPATGTPMSDNPELEALFKQLADGDAKCPPMTTGTNARVAKHYLERVGILEQIVEKAKDGEREPWQKQVIDSLGTAMQASEPGDTRAADALNRLAERFAKEKPGSDLAGYAAFRVLSTEYSVAVTGVRKAEDMLALQNKHVEKLTKFIQLYPRAEDAAEALVQLATIHEVQNKETEAKRYFTQLANSFPNTRQGLKAAGALRRFNLVGQPWEVNGPITSLTGHAFSMAQLRGRVVVVYYYASWCQSAPADLAKLSQIVNQNRSNKLDVVAINLDEEQNAAAPFVNQNPNCWHLFAGGGMDSPLAAQYGIIAPPTMFLVGRDGKVISRTIDLTGLDEELKKAVKP